MQKVQKITKLAIFWGAIVIAIFVQGYSFRSGFDWKFGPNSVRERSYDTVKVRKKFKKHKDDRFTLEVEH